MAGLQALGGAPVGFSGANGVQYAVPLSLISFPSATGSPVATAWLSGFTPAQAGVLGPLVGSALQTLVGQGLLVAGALPAAPPAFTVTARDGGSGGDDISVTFANVTPNGASPGQTLTDVTVSVTQPYPGLTLASIGTVLGTTAGGGTQPGLAYLSGTAAALPVNAAAAAFSGTPFTLAVAATSGTAFTLAAAHSEPGAELLKAAIANVDTSKGTFDLTLTWAKAATQLPLASLNTQFGYVLTVTPPAGGFAYPPASGVVTLVGGADPATSTAAATTAQATIIAG